MEELVYRMRLLMDCMSEEERKEAIGELLEGYCKYCLGRHTPCGCRNDE